MPLLGETTATTMTRPHRQLIELLVGAGLTVEVEAEFPPYRVDCYLPDLHVAVEADGPAHSSRKDEVRDLRLMSVYALPVYRLSAETLARSGEECWRQLALELMNKVWRDSTTDRRHLAKSAGGTG